MISYDICLCLTYLTLCDNLLDPSQLLQMALFHSFLWLSNIPLCVCVFHSFFIHFSVNEHLDCVRVLAIVNCAAVKTGMDIYFSSYSFLWI